LLNSIFDKILQARMFVSDWLNWFPVFHLRNFSIVGGWWVGDSFIQSINQSIRQ
jgi:hypothetical protein